MKKLFYICWIAAFLFALFVLIGGKVIPFGRLFIYQDKSADVYPGDLYKMCKIDKFKQTRDYSGSGLPSKTRETEIEPNYQVVTHGDSFSIETGDISDADILIFGDSFFAGIKALEIYQFNSGEPDTLLAVNASYFSAEAGENPLAYFNRMGFKNSNRKIVLLETVERYSLRRALKYRDFKRIIDSEYLRKFVKHIFVNDHLEYFFTDNIISHPVVKYLANFKYEHFGDIDTRIGLHSEDPKMLFYFQEVEFNRKLKTEDEFDLAISNITFVAERLNEQYNIELIYLIIPNKYSIYGDFVDPDYTYDKYIPKINDGLKKNKVNIIDLYSEYIDYRQNDNSLLLYPPSETHYSGLGRLILTDEIVARVLEINRK